MSGKKLKFRSIEQLNAQVVVVKNAPVANLVKSAPKLIKAAEEAETKDDPELVLLCICYLKFLYFYIKHEKLETCFKECSSRLILIMVITAP